MSRNTEAQSGRLVAAIGVVSVMVAAGLLLVPPADAVTLCNDGTMTKKAKRPCAGHGGIAVRDFSPKAPSTVIVDECPKGTKPSGINLCIFERWTEERVASSDTCWMKVNNVRDLVQVACRERQD
jgi:hypothetical protein